MSVLMTNKSSIGSIGVRLNPLSVPCFLISCKNEIIWSQFIFMGPFRKMK